MEHPKNEGCCLCPLLEADLEKATEANEDLLSVITDIRRVTGVGEKPMLSELAAAIGHKLALLRKRIQDAMNELGVPQAGYPQPVASAYEILKSARDGGALDKVEAFK